MNLANMSGAPDAVDASDGTAKALAFIASLDLEHRSDSRAVKPVVSENTSQPYL